LDRRLGGPQNRSGQCGQEKNLTPTDSYSNPLTVQPIAGHYTRTVAVGNAN
jgi:hypothetical protein